MSNASFAFAEQTKDMSPIDILNFYRNLYYTEPMVTERGIVANAINDVLPQLSRMVPCQECSYWKEYNACDGTKPHRCINHSSMFYKWTKPDDCYSYGERKNNNE